MTTRFGLLYAGWAGLAAGVVLMAAGMLGGELAAMMRGYGLLLALSAGWLLAGLALRTMVSRRRAPVPAAARRLLRETR
jgi:uncharacterized membrane protein (UPF0136 family)